MHTLPASADALPFDTERIPGRDLFVVAKYFSPTDAFVMRGCLVAAGIPAVVADANHVQADTLITPALGGVRVLVPEAHFAEAVQVLHAFERGEFALDDQCDVDGEEGDERARRD